MISAFGVEHTVSKSFVKLRPKLSAGLGDAKVLRHGTMDEKLRRHAVQHRMTAGGQGHRIMRRMAPEAREKMLNQPYQGKYTTTGPRREVLSQMKVGAHGIYDAIGREGRKNKVLP